jgi:hypothetical protein
MKSYISQEVADKLNDLLAMFFKANSRADNMAYALDCELECQNVSDIYHHKFAHLFPSDMFADGLSDVMIRSNIRPVRRSFEGDFNNYKDIVELFTDNVDMMEGLRNKVQDIIDDLDTDINNKEIVVELEDMLVSIVKLLKISNIWLEKAQDYQKRDDVRQFNVDFEKFVEI